MRLSPNAFPWLTLAVLAASAAASVSARLAGLSVGERSLLDAGEAWRWWTAHGVHFSAGHLLGSGLVWLAAGATVERVSRASLAGLLVAGAPFITWAALAGNDELARYGGLSGLATGAVVWLALHLSLSEKGWRRGAGLALLVAVVGRVGWDFAGGGPLVATFPTENDPVRVAVFAHVAGIIGGAVVYLGSRLRFGRARVLRF